jgi:hypothetical protein
VTSETALTELVSFCPIESEQAFADALSATAKTMRSHASEDAIALVKAAGFDAAQNAKRLMELYESRMGR